MKKELLEIKRTLTIDRYNITRITGYIVDNDRNCRLEFVKNFLNLEETETFKYLDILKKVLSGKPGRNMFQLDFKEKTRKQHLNTIVKTGLEDNDVRQIFLEEIAESIGILNKPYYENKYREVGDKCYHIGYSSYRLDVALEYREKYFELVERENDWIPVSERLPKKPEIDGDSDDYIVQTRRVAQPFIGYWDGREWTDEEVDILDEVIAWMPLPEPYKEVEDGN